jgi:hypothetical protein
MANATGGVAMNPELQTMFPEAFDYLSEDNDTPIYATGQQDEAEGDPEAFDDLLYSRPLDFN